MNSNDEIKKQKEITAIRKLIKLYPNELTYKENMPPKPDFEVEYLGNIIGVEVSEYINGQKYDEYKIKKRICSEVQKNFLHTQA